MEGVLSAKVADQTWCMAGHIFEQQLFIPFATMCSGSDNPVHWLKAFHLVLTRKLGKTQKVGGQLHHMFSAECNPLLQKFIRENKC